MTGEKIESLMYGWLTDNYPEGAVWLQKDHGLAELPPLELRMLHPLNEIEYNISNGGWAQFHWNHFSNWPEMLATAHAGYTLIGALEHAEAMNHLGDLCHRNDDPCYELLKRAVAERDAAETEEEMQASVQFFAEYMKLTEAETGTDWERLFYGTDIYEKRLTWLEANGARILAMIGRAAA